MTVMDVTYVVMSQTFCGHVGVSPEQRLWSF